MSTPVTGAPISLAVPFLEDGRLVLVRQFREAWQLSSWECPAGHGEPGESAEETARRELEEETGYRAKRFAKLAAIRASAKIPNVFSLFTAHELTPGPAHPDPGEELEVSTFSPEEVRGLFARGELVHGPSVTALLLAGVLVSVTPPRA